MFASHHKLGNLIVIIDYNKIQSLDFVNKTIKLEPLRKKFQAFGCKVISVNGHDHISIYKNIKKNFNRPLVIIANTIKGKGVSFMENKVLWHYKSPNQEELKEGLNQLKKTKIK